MYFVKSPNIPHKRYLATLQVKFHLNSKYVRSIFPYHLSKNEILFWVKLHSIDSIICLSLFLAFFFSKDLQFGPVIEGMLWRHNITTETGTDIYKIQRWTKGQKPFQADGFTIGTRKKNYIKWHLRNKHWVLGWVYNFLIISTQPEPNFNIF